MYQYANSYIDNSFINYIKNVSSYILSKKNNINLIRNKMIKDILVEENNNNTIYCEDSLPYRDGVFVYKNSIENRNLFSLQIHQGDTFLLDTDIPIEVIGQVSATELQVKDLSAKGEEIIISIFDIKEIYKSCP